MTNENFKLFKFKIQGLEALVVERFKKNNNHSNF